VAAARTEDAVTPARTLTLRTADAVDTLQPAGSVLDELLTAGQLAAILQMRVSTVEDYARRGILPSIKLGRHRRFVRSQVECVIDEMIGDAGVASGARLSRRPSSRR
jgi:excisionase family DNA binding protein